MYFIRFAHIYILIVAIITCSNCLTCHKASIMLSNSKRLPQFNSERSNSHDKDLNARSTDTLLGVFSKAHNAAFQSGVYGAVAGSVQVVSLMWLRTIINYQYRYGTSAMEAIRVLYAEGGVARFYQGMPYALIQNPLTKFGAVAANEGSKILVAHFSSTSDPSPLLSSALGTFLSILWRFFLVPLETLKTVLQVDGTAGFNLLLKEVLRGNLRRLYRGSGATIISTLLSHYPWFYVHNLLDSIIAKADDSKMIVLRSSLIGFIASAVSDCVSNVFRVVKTLQQTVGGDESSYVNIISQLYHEHGILGTVGRGLVTRIIANGFQSVVFVIVWKLIPIYVAKYKKRMTRSNERASNV